MSETNVKSHDTFVLPPSVVSRIDLSRLLAEVERVDNDITSEAIRHKDEEGYQPARPLLSEQLNDFLQANELNLDEDHGRSELISELRALKDNVPIVHMTFATVADRDSLGQLVTWLRESAHPQTVVAIGLQPSLVAGVYLRTPNHVYDLSLRAKLKENHSKLVSSLGELRG
jgi:hypothetical protein